MTMVKKSELAVIDFNNEATKSVFCGMLEGLKHPYILPVLEVPSAPHTHDFHCR